MAGQWASGRARIGAVLMALAACTTPGDQAVPTVDPTMGKPHASGRPDGSRPPATSASPTSDATSYDDPPLSGSKPRFDYNGDGFGDLAIAAPEEAHRVDSPGTDGPGALTILYGAAGGVTVRDAQRWQPDVLVPETGPFRSRFGYRMAAGDLNADGYDDLAVSDWTSGDNEGTVWVVFGSTQGLAFDAPLRLRQGAPLSDSPEPSDQFGAALAIGHFMTDVPGAQLAIVVPGERGYNGTCDAESTCSTRRPPDGHDLIEGVVHIVWGFGGAIRDRLIVPGGREGLPSSRPSADHSPRVGALATGRFDSDPADEVLVNVCADDRCDGYLLYGGSDGPTGARALGTTIDPMTPLAGMGIRREPGSNRGLIVFASGTTGADDGGAVTFIRSDDRGRPDRRRALTITRDSPRVPGRGDRGDRFGASLAVSDLDGDGVMDVIVGVPGDDRRGIADTGVVVRLQRRADGGIARTSRQIEQSDRLVPGRNDRRDRFGDLVVSDDLDGDGRPDLVIGLPGESIRGIRPGALVVLYATGSGEVIHQDVRGVPGRNQEGDRFGAVVNGTTGW